MTTGFHRASAVSSVTAAAKIADFASQGSETSTKAHRPKPPWLFTAGTHTYTSSRQINVIAPYEIAGQQQIAIQVQYQGINSALQTVQVVGASPGAYTLNSAGTGPVVALNQDYSINGPDNPAAKGSYVILYFTGGGQTDPAGATGSVTGAVLKWIRQAASVTVGNQAATVTFVGAAPTFVDGVNQLNVQLSPNTPTGAQPLVISIGGISSPATVTLAVQ